MTPSRQGQGRVKMLDIDPELFGCGEGDRPPVQVPRKVGQVDALSANHLGIPRAGPLEANEASNIRRQQLIPPFAVPHGRQKRSVLKQVFEYARKPIANNKEP